MAFPLEVPSLTWTKDDRYLISTDSSLIPLDELNEKVFGADDLSWGCPLPLEQLQTLIRRSICFALYELDAFEAPVSKMAPVGHQLGHNPHTPITTHAPKRRLIGFARFITDLVTVHYLTDVYILPQYRSQGLGGWMMDCIDQVFNSTPYLRGMILITDRGSQTEEFYRKHLGMRDLEGVGFCMDRKGRGVVRVSAEP